MSRQLGQVGQDGLIPDKFDITPGEIHNTVKRLCVCVCVCVPSQNTCKMYECVDVRRRNAPQRIRYGRTFVEFLRDVFIV